MKYVYRFINNDSKIIYVGKCEVLKRRMLQHAKSKNVKYRTAYEEAVRIEYIIEPTPKEARIKELYYINLYKPKYNEQDKQEEEITLRLKNDIWLTYSSPEHCIIDKLKREKAGLEFQIRSYREIVDRLINADSREEIRKLENRVSEVVRENSQLKKENQRLQSERNSFIEIKELLKKTLLEVNPNREDI